MPRRDYPKIHQRLLHDRTSRKIAHALGRYPNIDIATVAYYVDPAPKATGVVAGSSTVG